MKERKGSTLSKTLIIFFLVVWALIVLFPFYWMVLTSFKDTTLFMDEKIPTFFTTEPTLANYGKAFTEVPLGRFLLNTLIFTVATTALMMAVIVPAAFAFARLEFKGRNLVFALFLSLMMIPTELVIITNYATIVHWNMRNTFLGLILPSVTRTSDLKYMLRVMVPICQPTIVTIVILKVIECWNSYIWPRQITDKQNWFLVSQGIQSIRESGYGREDIPAMMAAVVVVSVPLIVLFLIFRDKIMAGVSRGGTKG